MPRNIPNDPDLNRKQCAECRCRELLSGAFSGRYGSDQCLEPAIDNLRFAS